MKKILVLTTIYSLSFLCFSKVHDFTVWDGYMQFFGTTETIYVGDTIRWSPLSGGAPSMAHTITSTTIPEGAASFDEPWEGPGIPTFEYVVTQPGKYDYVCTPHIEMGMVGSFEVLSLLTSVNSLGKTEGITLYPTEANDIVYLDKLVGTCAYMVCDSKGGMILEGRTSGQIDVNGLISGKYHLILKGKQSALLRFVVN